jgi:EPS-associated MarR family transcriptional regulator|tara:strand:+ start:571 stop:897 length:327 start_codon:yes stop_codon:yes gene_type:complete
LKKNNNIIKISEDNLKIMQMIEENGNISQRQLSKKLGFSLGKINYCISALTEIGFIKVKNFSESDRKLNYLYILTPLGVKEKTKITLKFIEKKKREYDILVKNINGTG